MIEVSYINEENGNCMNMQVGVKYAVEKDKGSSIITNSVKFEVEPEKVMTDPSGGNRMDAIIIMHLHDLFLNGES